ncbi:MAG: DoxX family membrane protein [Chitinophagaceae bacterium]|nr:MAG: DoxX family membrane protein [Chitinophagaceae bacterium]
MIKRNALDVIRLLFILLFVYTAFSKILDYQNFRAVIGQSPMLTRFASVLAIAVPVAEILIALMLVIPRYRRAGLYASFAMMMLFTTYIIILVTMSDKIPCSCGGVISMMTWQQHLYFNIFFILLGLTGMYLDHKKDNSEPAQMNGLTRLT